MTSLLPPPALARYLRAFAPLFSGVRPATPEQSRAYLQGDAGFVALDAGDVVGYVGYRRHNGGLYAHSLRSWGPPSSTVRLVQRMRRHARSLGLDHLTFHVARPELDMLRLVGPKVRIESAVLRMECR